MEIKNTRILLNIAHDVVTICVAWFAAYWLRMNLADLSVGVMRQAFFSLAFVLPIQLVFAYVFGLYRGMWRFSSTKDLQRVIKSVVLASVTSLVVLYFVDHLSGVPRAILPLYALLTIMFWGGSRLMYRWFYEHKASEKAYSRVMIVGAGDAGESLVRSLKRVKNATYVPVVFIDDDRAKLGRELHGVRVSGVCEEIPALIEKYHIDFVFIALPTIGSAKIRQIYGYTNQLNIPCRTLPGINDLAEDRVGIKDLRDVSLEDLLGREPVKLDKERIDQGICQQQILISGAGGSIGSELCRQIARLKPALLVLVEQCEYNLYSVEQELQSSYPALELRSHLVDVKDEVAVKEVFAAYNINFVFHAAAYKHVPMLQNQIRTAVSNNVLGTKTLAETAIASGVQRFVLISTDKAVKPSNIMGTTKRAAEMLCQAYNKQSDTQFITVRFGNVLGSAGSVVPLFSKQLAAGGPLTVTHPDMTRFFMTIPEASQLILQASIVGDGGEIFVLDMGEAIKISFLAEQLISLAGKTVDEVGIKYIGLRPGEKLYEELFYDNEELLHTNYDKLLQARHVSVDEQHVFGLLAKLVEACQSDASSLLSHLKLLVPEYQEQSAVLEEETL